MTLTYDALLILTSKSKRFSKKSLTLSPAMNSVPESDWPLIMIEYVRISTRKHQFDFSKVSEDLRQFSLSEPDLTHYFESITSASCRNCFANDFSRLTDERSKSESRREPISPRTLIPDTSNLSFEETMTIVSRIAEENEQKKIAVFQRVLQSMAGESAMCPSTDELGDSDFAFLKSVFDESKKKREADQLARDLKTQELEEQRLLEEQRTTLRRRFEKDSADAIGLDPMIAPKKYELDGDNPTDGSEAKYATFDIEEILATAEFELLLSEIERDLSERDPQYLGATEDSGTSRLAFLLLIGGGFLLVFLLLPPPCSY